MKIAFKAFTIIELLIVILVIAILATLTIIGYSGISSKANVTAIQSDLTNNSKKLKLYNTQYNSYPLSLDTNNCPLTPIATTDSIYCLKASANTTLTYQATSTTYSLHATNSNITYRINDYTVGTPIATSIICPVGFIVVPGSSTYGTNDFCVMKYEAKADDNGDGTGDTNRNTGYDSWPADTHPISPSRKIVSTPLGYPVAFVSQTTAISISNSTNGSVYGCSTGCHLITESEWMTIAQNVLSVPSNWSGGAVGSGYIYSGHTDSVPAKFIEADIDSNGYINTSNSTVSGPNQKRTLSLTNGEVVWDLPGNIWEWTSGQTTGNQPGASANTTFQYTQWTAVNVAGSLLVNPFPSSTGISGSGSWTNANGIGMIYSYTSDSVLRGFMRGGRWSNDNTAGILTLYLGYTPSTSGFNVGFRVSK